MIHEMQTEHKERVLPRGPLIPTYCTFSTSSEARRISHHCHAERQRSMTNPRRVRCFADAQHDKQMLCLPSACSSTLGMLLDEYVGINAFKVARGWGCGPFSDNPTSSGDPQRATDRAPPCHPECSEGVSLVGRRDASLRSA
jgi:hypothetical protein